MKKLIVFMFLLSFFSCTPHQKVPEDYFSNTLKVEKIKTNVFKHVSYLDTENFGKVACNGMIYFFDNQAIIFDTPTNDDSSIELINWIQKELKFKIEAVVISHFHTDCLGGLAAFHNENIPSYAHNLTIDFAKKNSLEKPRHGFDTELKLRLSDREIISSYFGAGHTYDNTVSYIPSENVLFGGCLIKSVGAKKGNLADADTLSWSKTVSKLQLTYTDLKYVIPGHGKSGSDELLTYTIDLFKNE